jgi:hypothetical protein
MGRNKLPQEFGTKGSSLTTVKNRRYLHYIKSCGTGRKPAHKVPDLCGLEAERFGSTKARSISGVQNIHIKG